LSLKKGGYQMNFTKKILMTISVLIVMSCLLIVPCIAQVLSSQTFLVIPTQNSVFDVPPTFSLFPSQAPVFNFAFPPLINTTPQFFFPQQGFNLNFPFAAGQSTNSKSNSLKTSSEVTANDTKLINRLLELMPTNAEVYKYQENAKIAFVNFYSDMNNCEYIDGYLQVSDGMFKYAPGPPERPGPMGYLYINIDDWCEGDSRYGFANFELESLSISPDFRSAYAKGQGIIYWESPWYPYPPPQPLPEEFTIEVTWTGENMVVSGHNNFRSSNGGVRTIIHACGKTRFATVTGTVTGETFEFELEAPPIEPPPPPYPPYPYAGIGRNRAGFISISKP
jgi:hypothetical protein